MPAGVHTTLGGRSVDLSQAEGGTALAETGAGLELDGGIAYASASSGLSAAATVRMPATHADSEHRGWGASLTARLDPGERGGGGHVLGQPAQGLRAEPGYRLPLFSGRVNGTPNLGLAVSDDGARDRRIGWRFDPAARDDPGFEVNLDAMRRVAANDGTPQHGVLLTGAVRW